MGSLATCLKLHGIEAEEALLLRRSIKSYRKEGFDVEEARDRAVSDVLSMLNADLEEIRKAVISKQSSVVSEQPETVISHQSSDISEQPTAVSDQPSSRKAKRVETVNDWISSQGRINYAKEHWKGELDALSESNPKVKVIINRKGKGLLLDDLALKAKDEGFIAEATPEALLEAMEKNQTRPQDIEAQIEARMEAEQRRRLLEGNDSEEIVERWFASGKDVAGEYIGKGDGPDFKSAKEEIDKFRTSVEKLESAKSSFEDIVLCIRQEG